MLPRARPPILTAGTRRTAGPFARLSAALRSWMASQQDRFILCLPLAVTGGAIAYFLAPEEPAVWPSVVAFAVGLFAAAVIGGRIRERTDVVHPALAGVCALIGFFALGVLVSQAHAHFSAPPRLEAPLEGAAVEGWVVSRDISRGRERLVIATTQVVSAEGRPMGSLGKVRVSMPLPRSEAGGGGLGPGRAVRCRAQLSAPPSPLAPGSYDFERRAYFDGLTAVGFSFGRCRPVAHLTAPLPRVQRWTVRLAAVRADAAAAIVAIAPGQGGAVAAALITGDRAYIDEVTNAALRDAGLAHVLSVSGMHMAILGGMVFFVLRTCLALIPWLALRVPVAKVAAATALVILAVYCLFTGASVPAQRAFVMAGVAFGAVLIDRPAISMRGLALALLLIVLASPQAVVEPGFQMSFAATAALVAAYEMLSARDRGPPLPSPGPVIGALQGIWAGLAGVLATSFVAGLASELFALQHFHRIALYGLPVNLTAAPVMTFLVAPSALAAGFASLFGFEAPFLRAMAWGLELMIGLARGFADRPEAVRASAALAPWVFGWCAAGLVWAALWRGPTRSVGAFACLLAAGVCARDTGAPVLAFTADLRHVYVREALSSQPQSGFAFLAQSGRWTRLGPARAGVFEREALAALVGITPAATLGLGPPVGCEALADGWAKRPAAGDNGADAFVGSCTVPLSPGMDLVIVTHADAFAAACQDDGVIVSTIAMPAALREGCRGLILDQRSRQALGGGAIVELGPAGLHVRTTDACKAERPWRNPRAPGCLGVATHEGDEPTLHLDAVGPEDAGLVGGVGGFERD